MSKWMMLDAITELRDHWDATEFETRKELISVLFYGCHMSYQKIASLIGKSVEEVKAGHKPLSALPPEFEEEQNKKLEEVIKAANSKLEEVAPIKKVYTKTLDEIMADYREWIGWKEPIIPFESSPIESDYLNGIIISDIHAPFHDEEAFFTMIADNKGKTDICILGGDGPDFHNYSKYIKYGQHFTMQEEHKAYMSVLATLSESFPEVVVIPGNHDERSRKKYAGILPADLYQSILEFHGNNAFDFAELMALQFDNIIVPDCPKHGFAEYRFIYQFGDLIIGHPELFSRVAGQSVANFIEWLKKKAEPMGLVKPFKHVIMGHTHQGCKIVGNFGIIGIENASLCLTPDYDSGAKLSGVLRPPTLGYTKFKMDRATMTTNINDINLIVIR